MRKFWRHNSLSLVFGVLLLAALLGQSLSGLGDYNEEVRTLGLQQIGWWRYVTSSRFVVDLTENWQSEYLQFVLYILLSWSAQAVAGRVAYNQQRIRDLLDPVGFGGYLI